MIQSAQNTKGGESDVSDDSCGNAFLRDCECGNPACLEPDEVCLRAGTVLLFPGAVCACGAARMVQPSVAADPDRRTVIRRNVQKSITAMSDKKNE